MKKKIMFVLVLAMLASLCACGEGGGNAAVTTAGTEVATEAVTTEVTTVATTAEPEIPAMALGETASTDIVSLTLDWAQLAIALDNAWDDGEDYLMPKEYNAEEDSDNPFVAAKGHTLVAMTFTVENLDRSSIDLDGSFNPQFIAVEYGDKKYEPETEYGACGVANENGLIEWESYSSINVYVSAGEKETYKCYVDIPVEAASLEDTFEVTFSLPDSAGKTEDFVFTVDSEGLAAAKDARDAAIQAAKDAEAAELEASLAEVDADTAAVVTDIVQGNWEYTTNNIKYELTFNGNYISVVSTVAGYQVTNQGTFSVRRDYILIEYDNGGRAGIPYTYENGEFNMNAIVGFDS